MSATSSLNSGSKLGWDSSFMNLQAQTEYFVSSRTFLNLFQTISVRFYAVFIRVNTN